MFNDLTFEELNNLVTSRSIPYDEYFGDMELTEAEKEERKSLAEKLEKNFLPVLILLFTMAQYNAFDWNLLRERFIEAYTFSIKGYITLDDYMSNYIKDFAYDIIQSTIDNINDMYFYSSDRSILLAENEANTTLNYNDYLKAVLQGKKNKVWIDVRDSRERKTHLAVGGTIKKIDDAFLVGDSLMMFPKDTSMGASAKEIVNCRCTIKYY